MRPPAGAQAALGRVQGRCVGHLEGDVVVAAPRGVLDQDQLVVALVAGQVGRAGQALCLDQAEDVALEIDGCVQVRDAQCNVSHSGDHVQLPFADRWSERKVSSVRGG